jgi:hypothetical protein
VAVTAGNAERRNVLRDHAGDVIGAARGSRCRASPGICFDDSGSISASPAPALRCAESKDESAESAATDIAGPAATRDAGEERV